MFELILISLLIGVIIGLILDLIWLFRPIRSDSDHSDLDVEIIKGQWRIELEKNKDKDDYHRRLYNFLTKK